MKIFTLFIFSKFLKESQCTHAKFRELINSFLLGTNKISNTSLSEFPEASISKTSFFFNRNLLMRKKESNQTHAFYFLSTSKNYYHV